MILESMLSQEWGNDSDEGLSIFYERRQWKCMERQEELEKLHDTNESERWDADEGDQGSGYKA